MSMHGLVNEGSSSNSPADSPTAGIAIPPLNGTIGHSRQKPSRVGLGERQYSYDVTTGPSARVVPRSNPSPPPIHSRHYSESTAGEKTPPYSNGTRNASISTLDTQAFSTSGGDGGYNMSGGRRRHGHGHSHGQSRHHHPAIPGPAPPKPASMMSTSEYALHILFTNFVRIVEEKMKAVMAVPIDVEPDILAHFGPGADPTFDKVLTSLGHIGSQNPTPVINTVMYWR